MCTQFNVENWWSCPLKICHISNLNCLKRTRPTLYFVCLHSYKYFQHCSNSEKSMIVVRVQVCVIWSPVAMISREMSDNMPESKEGSCQTQLNVTWIKKISSRNISVWVTSVRSVMVVLSVPSLCLPPGEVTRDNPYEDVKLSPMCLPIGRPTGPKVLEDVSPFHSPRVFVISCV